jgi:hypothetical protein
MRTTMNVSREVSGSVLAASRQVWLAGLGAAVVTRDWAQTEASSVLRTLIKEGTAVESRAIRVVGHRIEGSMSLANAAWRQARATVESSVRNAANAAVAIAQSSLPKSLPKVTLPAMLHTAPARKAKVARTKRAVRKSPAKAAKAVKRTARAATRK